MERVLELIGAVWRCTVFAVVGVLWTICFGWFCLHMQPRLAYLTGQQQKIGIDAPCLTPECDFTDFWSAGYTARVPAGELKSLHLQLQPGVRFPLPGGYSVGFPYPPPIFLPAAAVSFLPFEWAFFAWGAAWISLAVVLLRWAKFSWPVVALGLLSPAALTATEVGQVGVIGGALLVAGLMALAARPLRGGMLLALLACKPQYGIMVPAALLGSRSWRGAAGVALGGAVLVLVTISAFGWPLWQGYLNGGRQGGATILTAPFVPYFGVGGGISVFWMLRSLHAGLGLAGAGQAFCSAAAMFLVVWIRRQGEISKLDAMTLTVFLSLIAMPYGYVDDMVAWSIALAALAEARGWRIDMFDALFWLWPMLCPVMSIKTGILWTPVVAAMAVARSWYLAGLPLPYFPRRVTMLPGAHGDS